MKVLFSVGVDDYTGANRMTHTYMRGLAAAGDAIYLVHPSESAFSGVGERQPRFSALARAEGVIAQEVPDFPFKLSLRGLFRICAFLSRERPEIVVSTFQSDAKILGPLCAAAGIPFVYFAQNLGQFSGGRLLSALKKNLWGFALRGCTDVAVATGKEVGENLVYEHGFESRIIRVITNAVALPPVKDACDRTQAFKQEVGATDRTFVILNVGRLDEQKGQSLLVEAVQLLDVKGVDFRLLFAGGMSPTGVEKSSSYYASLVARVAELGLEKRVLFLGWRNDIADLLAQADVYVHSALWEGFPLAVLDAWAAARPVVTTDCFHIPAKAGPLRWGKVVPVGNAKALASAILEIQQSAVNARRAMGTEARRFAEKYFDLNERLKEMRDCLIGTLATRGSGHVI